MTTAQSQLNPDTILKDVPADKPRYEDSWSDKYKSKFKDLLDEFDEKTLDVIRNILGI